jgi:hypothetical protein
MHGRPGVRAVLRAGSRAETLAPPQRLGPRRGGDLAPFRKTGLWGRPGRDPLRRRSCSNSGVRAAPGRQLCDAPRGRQPSAPLRPRRRQQNLLMKTAGNTVRVTDPSARSPECRRSGWSSLVEASQCEVAAASAYWLMLSSRRSRRVSIVASNSASLWSSLRRGFSRAVWGRPRRSTWPSWLGIWASPSSRGSSTGEVSAPRVEASRRSCPSRKLLKAR